MNRYRKILTIIITMGAPCLQAAHHHEKDAKPEALLRAAPVKPPGQLYVAFSGETGDRINVLRAFSTTDGSSLGPVFAASPNFRELRNVVLDSAGNLYVINAYKDNSALLKFGPTQADGITRLFLGRVVAASVVPGLAHPYDIASSSSGGFFMSCQDSNIVLQVSDNGTPAPLPLSLAKAKGPFAAGTFVPAFSARSSVPCPIEAAKGGLTLEGAHSVRGIASNLGDPAHYLCVADQAANRVAVYDAKGVFSASETISGHGLEKPTQVLWHGGLLYITCPGSASVYRYDFAKKTMSTFIAADKKRLGTMSGIAFDSAGNCYVADRDTKALYLYSSAGTLVSDPLINFPAQGGERFTRRDFYSGLAIS